VKRLFTGDGRFSALSGVGDDGRRRRGGRSFGFRLANELFKLGRLGSAGGAKDSFERGSGCRSDIATVSAAEAAAPSAFIEKKVGHTWNKAAFKLSFSHVLSGFTDEPIATSTTATRN
jgi:hypothetical protein